MTLKSKEKYSDDFRNKFNNALRLKDSCEYDESYKILSRLAEEKPYSAAVYGALGTLFWEQDKLEEAIYYFRKATALSPTSELASLALYHSLWKLEMLDEALEEMKRFLTYSDSDEYQNILSELKHQID